MAGGEKPARRSWHLRGQQRGRKRNAMEREVEEESAFGSGLCHKPALPSGEICPSPGLRPLIFEWNAKCPESLLASPEGVMDAENRAHTQNALSACAHTHTHTLTCTHRYTPSHMPVGVHAHSHSQPYTPTLIVLQTHTLPCTSNTHMPILMHTHRNTHTP